MITGLYLRSATRDNLESFESIGILTQRKSLQSYAKENNIVSLREYFDDGFSGKNLNRPSLNSLIEDIEKGEIGKVVVTSLDRFSRNMEDVKYLIELFDRHNVSIVFLDTAGIERANTYISENIERFMQYQ